MHVYAYPKKNKKNEKVKKTSVSGAAFPSVSALLFLFYLPSPLQLT